MRFRWFKTLKMELTRSSSRKFLRQMSTEGKEKPLLTAAVCQMTSRSDKNENFNICKQLVTTAKNKGAKMVFLPEAFDYISEKKEQTIQLAEPITGELIENFKNLAKEKEIWISLGGFHEKGSSDNLNRINNSHIVINDIGEINATYKKIHLFDVTLQTGQKMHESDYVIPGSIITSPVDTPIGRVGLGICYDVRFPEFSIALTQMGAEILTFPSAFTISTGLAHWEVLLRSRAIENQCYVIAAAQTGIHNERRQSYGHAMIVDPWGAIVAQCHEGTDVAVADIDLSFLHQIRRDMPVWFHRRKELYEPDVQCEPINDSDQFQFGQHLLKNAQLFFKSKLSVAFVNRKPVLPGHILVSPIRVAKRIADLTREEISDLFLCVQKLQKLIENEFDAHSSTVTVQDGVDAGQTVEHVHVHILPRKEGNFANNDEIYERLENHDKNENNLRTEEEMASEAKNLREKLMINFSS